MTLNRRRTRRRSFSPLTLVISPWRPSDTLSGIRALAQSSLANVPVRPWNSAELVQAARASKPQHVVLSPRWRPTL